VRHELGLPGLERRIGLAAHDFAVALGGREVLVTRARRDARAPAIASRFWLRLEAMTAGITRSPRHRGWARGARPSGGFHPRRAPRAEAARGRAAAADRRHRRRPAQGRSLRLLRPQDACLGAARCDRRRSERRLARQRRPQDSRGVDEGGRLRAAASRPRAEALLLEAPPIP
jgi:hypothetical protein